MKKTEKYFKPYLSSRQRYKISIKMQFDLVSIISGNNKESKFFLEIFLKRLVSNSRWTEHMFGRSHQTPRFSKTVEEMLRTAKIIVQFANVDESCPILSGVFRLRAVKASDTSPPPVLCNGTLRACVVGRYNRNLFTN